MWWAVVISNPQFEILSPIIKATLSIFTGPRVESSFNMMNNIITTATNRLDVGNYEAIHKINHKLLNEMKTSVALYQRDDPVFSPVDPPLYLQTAGKRISESIQKKCKKFHRQENITIHQTAQNPRHNVESRQTNPLRRKALRNKISLHSQAKRPAQRYKE